MPVTVKRVALNDLYNTHHLALRANAIERKNRPELSIIITVIIAQGYPIIQTVARARPRFIGQTHVKSERLALSRLCWCTKNAPTPALCVCRRHPRPPVQRRTTNQHNRANDEDGTLTGTRIVTPQRRISDRETMEARVDATCIVERSPCLSRVSRWWCSRVTRCR